MDVRLEPKRLMVRAYLAFCRAVALLAAARMGACQFCRREMFALLSGYDETVYVGEDVEFAWRLSRAARRRARTTAFVRDLSVFTSSRRFDTWPLWRTVLMTHPALILVLCRRASVWRDWYDPASAPR